jgi:hypothetical protein
MKISLLLLSILFISLGLSGCAPGDITETVYTQDLLPSANQLYDLGSPDYKWNNGYFHDLHVDTETLYIGGQALADFVAVHSTSTQSKQITTAWLGSFTSSPTSPNLYNAYYNLIDKKSYIYDGNKWQVITQDGEQGIQGTQGIPGSDANVSAHESTYNHSLLHPETHTHTGVYEPANSNIQAHVVSVHAPSDAQPNADITKAEIEAKLTGELTSHSHANGGYTINVQALTSSPADGATVYFGTLPKAPTTTANISKIYIRKAGTIKIAEIYCYSGTAGTNEVWSLYIRKNNNADTLIATKSVATNERVFNNASLSIAVVAGDYIEIKGVQPTWTTNPLTCIYGGYIYLE